MATEEIENRLTAWWLGLAPSRQEELLEGADPAPQWFVESIAEADLDESDVGAFLRRTRESVRDAGGNPKPD